MCNGSIKDIVKLENTEGFIIIIIIYCSIYFPIIEKNQG